MKCTLRKVNGGIVATIEERPKELDWYVDISSERYQNIALKCTCGFESNFKEWHKIIASTIPNVGKELKLIDDFEVSDFGIIPNEWLSKPYDYTETDNQVIIEL